MNNLIIVLAILGIVNILRVGFYMVASDIYEVNYALRNKRNKNKRPHRPTISIVVPAHNEGSIILNTLKSLQASNYPKNKMEIIVVNDGSTDNTAQIVRKYIADLKKTKNQSLLKTSLSNHKPASQFTSWPNAFFPVRLVSQKNAGKAAALNNGIKNYAQGNLVMCLDGDSLIDPNMVKNSVAYFRDRRVVAMASNVNIIEDGTVLSLVQRFEYILCGHMKKAQTAMNIEYIIGGIGSVFRRSVLKRVNFYDTNTMTEDIDLTMKIISRGNKKNRVIFAADAISYTEGVVSVKSLIRQRFRWKFGRMQTFLKNRSMFFKTSQDFSKPLTWFMLPFAVVQEALLFLEPLVVGYMVYSSIHYRSPRTMIFVACVISAYLLIAIWSTAHLSVKAKIRLSLLAPTQYFLIYLLTLVEYLSLALSISKLPRLKKSIGHEFTTWKSPERTGAATQ